jgi:hypothetical protein
VPGPALLGITAAFTVWSTRLCEVVEGGGGGVVVDGVGGVTAATLTVVVCTILVLPSIVVALVTVAVGTNGARPPKTGSQI